MPPRVKRFVPKVKSGCITCKKRRVKCTEERPRCTRCVRGNFQCEGYTALESKLFELDSRTAADRERGLVVSRLAKTLQPTLYQYSAEEHRSLVYWLEITAPNISKESTSRVQLWNITLPQISHHDDIVKHALTAVSLGDEALSSASKFEGIEGRRDYHYAVALHQLIQKNPSVESTLFACALLFTYECFRQSAKGASIHASNGKRIVDEYRARCEQGQPLNPSHDLIIGTLDTFFSDAMRYVKAVFPNEVFKQNTRLIKRPPFRSLKEAQQDLTALIRDLTRVDDDYEFVDHVLQLETWHEPFDAMLKKPPLEQMKPTSQLHQTARMVSRMLSAPPDEGVRATRVDYILKGLKNLTRMDTLGLDQGMRMIVDFMESFCLQGEESMQIQELQKKLKPLPVEE